MQNVSSIRDTELGLGVHQLCNLWSFTLLPWACHITHIIPRPLSLSPVHMHSIK